MAHCRRRGYKLALRVRYIDAVTYILKEFQVFCIYDDVFMRVANYPAILSRVSFLPDVLSDKIVGSKNGITKIAKVTYLVIIDADKYHSVFPKQIPC